MRNIFFPPKKADPNLEEETEERFVGFAASSLENVQNVRRWQRDKTNPQNE